MPTPAKREPTKVVPKVAPRARETIPRPPPPKLPPARTALVVPRPRGK